MLRIIIPLAVILGVACIWAIYKDDEQWKKFAVEHNCKVVAVTESKTIITGRGDTAVIPGSKTYLCDDGVKYTRSN